MSAAEFLRGRAELFGAPRPFRRSVLRPEPQSARSEAARRDVVVLPLGLGEGA